MKSIILAAGVGSRLGDYLPKCLAKLPSGKTLIENQIEVLRGNGIYDVTAVVGFKKEIIMEWSPSITFRYNPVFHITNTSKSLMMALSGMEPDDTIWLNGDVFLESEVIKRVCALAGNVVAVNRAKCGQEEVKYSTDPKGFITAISKQVTPGEGEAVGINKISAQHFTALLDGLSRCKNDDYFEKGIEICIANGVDFWPINISDCKCVEIDFKADLEKVYQIFDP